VAAAQSTAAFLNPAGLNSGKEEENKSPFPMKHPHQLLSKLQKMTQKLI